MRTSTNLFSEQGSAIVDLIGFGLMLQIPILMFATFAVSTQQQSFALESIARHALRAHSLWPVRESTQAVAVEIAKEFGIVPVVYLAQNQFTSVHGVPAEKLEQMRTRFQYDISELFGVVNEE